MRTRIAQEIGLTETIGFNIPNSDAGCNGTTHVCTINVGSTSLGPLPNVTGSTTINGYSQSGSSANAQTTSDNAVVLIELRGTSAGAGADGLTLSGGSSTVRGDLLTRLAHAQPLHPA